MPVVNTAGPPASHRRMPLPRTPHRSSSKQSLRNLIPRRLHNNLQTRNLFPGNFLFFCIRTPPLQILFEIIDCLIPSKRALVPNHCLCQMHCSTNTSLLVSLIFAICASRNVGVCRKDAVCADINWTRIPVCWVLWDFFSGP